MDVAAHDHWSSKSYALPAEAKVYRERALSASKERGARKARKAKAFFKSPGRPLRGAPSARDLLAEIENRPACLRESVATVVMWTVYKHPNDYPAEYVARKFLIAEDFYTPSSESISSRSLRDVRKVLQSLYPGLIQLKRPPEDEPHIVEVWL